MTPAKKAPPTLTLRKSPVTNDRSIIVRLLDDGRPSIFLIGFGSTEAAAQRAIEALSNLLRTIERGRLMTMEVNPVSGQDAVEGVYSRVAVMVEEAERKVNRLRKDIEAVESGTVHRIFFEMVRALRICKALVIASKARREEPSYVGIVRLRQCLADVYATVRKTAQTADAALHEER